MFFPVEIFRRKLASRTNCRLTAEATTYTAIVLCTLQLLFPPGLLHTLPTSYMISFRNGLKIETNEASFMQFFPRCFSSIFSDSVLFSHLLRMMWHALASQSRHCCTRSRVRFPMMLLEVLFDVILPLALWPWGRLNLQQKLVPGIFREG